MRSGRITKALRPVLAVLSGLALFGCWFPRLLMAAFIPIQPVLVWLATIGARYGAPLVMLMFVDGSDMTVPRDSDGLPRAPFVCFEDAPVGSGCLEGVSQVIFADFSRLKEEEWLRIQQTAAARSQRLVLAPAGDWPERLESLESEGISVKFKGETL